LIYDTADHIIGDGRDKIVVLFPGSDEIGRFLEAVMTAGPKTRICGSCHGLVRKERIGALLAPLEVVSATVADPENDELNFAEAIISP
jgi:hypothetical protein